MSQGLNAHIDPLRIRAGMEFAYFDTGSPILHKSFSRKLPLPPLEATHFIRIRDLETHLRMKRQRRPLLKKLGYRGIKLLNSARNTARRDP